jgi:hypothetical protein
VKPSNVKPSNVKPSNVKPSNVKPSNVKPSRERAGGGFREDARRNGSPAVAPSVLRLAGQAALAGGAVRTFETDAEFSRRKQARLAELVTLGTRRLSALSRTPDHEKRSQQRANDG